MPRYRGNQNAGIPIGGWKWYTGVLVVVLASTALYGTMFWYLFARP